MNMEALRFSETSDYVILPTTQCNISGLTFENGTVRLSRNVLNIYQYKLRNNPEERGLHMHRGGNLKPRRIPNIKSVGTSNLTVRDEFVCGALRALR
jgi:hypothetical protein